MKKLLAIILATLMVVTFVAACDQADDPAPTPTPTPTPTPADTTETNPDPEPDPEPADDFDTSRRIGVYTREEGSGTRGAFEEITGVGDDMYVEAVTLTSGGEIRSAVADNPYGIGYLSLGSLNDTVKAVNINGVVPSSATVIDGSYAIQRPFLLVTNDDNEANELVQDFMAFVFSAQGQEHVATSWVTPGDTGDYTPSGVSGLLKIGGSTSVAPLIHLIAAAYEDINSDVSIEVSEGGSGTGISEAISGVVNIGMSSRNLRDEEKSELNEHVIALDGVAVIVALDNPLGNLDMDTVREIFVGDKINWSDILG